MVGVDGITSGPPGGTLTFSGINLLALATVNGSINLTSDVSFQDISVLAMYARGATSDLTLNSSISNVGALKLAAERSIQITNAGTLSVGGFDATTGGGNLTVQVGALSLNGEARFNAEVLPDDTITNGANIILNVTNDLTNNSTTDFSRLQVTNQGHIGTGGNISVNIGGDLTATGPGSTTEFPEPGDFEAVVQNTNAQIDNGGNLNLTVGGNVHVNGLALYVQNYDETMNPAGHIGTGGNIDVEIGGNLTANSYVDVFLNNRGGGMIGSGGSLTFNVTGALNIGADAGGTGLPGFSSEFIISTRYDDSAGNTTPSFIGSDVSLFLHAASVSMAGDLFGSGISNHGGSIIDGNATTTWDVPGAVSIQGDASWWVLNNIVTDYHFAPPLGGTIHGSATVTLNIGGDLTTAGDAGIYILNQRNFEFPGPSAGTIDSDATLNISAANFSVGGELDIYVNNRNNGSGAGSGGSIGGNAAINLKLSGNLTITGTDPNSTGTPGLASIAIFNEGFVAGSPGGFIRGNATIAVTATGISTANKFDVEIDNEGGGHVGGDASVTLNAAAISNANTGSTGQLSLLVNNYNGGSIGGKATVTLNTSGDVMSGGSDSFDINNSGGGSIGSDGNVLVSIGGSYTAGDVETSIDNSNGGHIGTDANIILSTGGDLKANSLFVFSNDRDGGAINSVANVNVAIGGNLKTVGDVTVGTSARLLNEGSRGGTIGSDVFVGLTANSISAGGFFETFISTLAGGSITGNAQTIVAMPGDLSANGGILVPIYVDGFISIDPLIFVAGGRIGGNASVSLTAQNILTTSTASGTPGLDTMALEASIYTDASGSVGGNADVVVQAQQNISAPGTSFFTVANGNFQGYGGGTIGGNAELNISAVNLTTGALFADIYNYGGAQIGGNANINFNLTGNLTTQSDANFLIDNSNGGTIGGNATINMNVSGNAAVTSNATVQILGSDGAANGAAINFNSGNYVVGGTFLSTIDGNGIIAFNSASVHADVLKAGVFGTNGVLNIGGGNLSANTTLELYAPGSSGGQLNFISDVTLGGNSTKILAADSVTIFNGVTVTIAGPNLADVYTNNANYARSDGGNGSTSGTFAGGANNPQPLSSAPPFDSPSTRVATRSTRTSAAVIHVTDSSQLSSLLDNAAPGPNGKIRISPDGRSRNQSVQGSTRTIAAELHRSVDTKARSGMLASRLP
jgi:hypothetical protein